MKTSTRTYTLTIEKHPGGYLAYFPALTGCQTWGRTYEEAVTHAEEALAVYLETLVDHGDPLPEGAQRPARIPRHYGEDTRRRIVCSRGFRVGARKR
jgi:antitoxin HicB